MEIEWQKIKVELANRISTFIEDMSEDKTDIDPSVCGWFPDDIALRMAECAVNVLQASASGQAFVRKQEIECV